MPGSPDTLMSFSPPLVIAFGEWGEDFDLLTWKGRDLHLIGVTSIDEIPIYPKDTSSRLGAFVFDGRLGAPALREALTLIDASFRASNGPVFVITDDANASLSLGEEVVYFARPQGINPFRRTLADAVEDFIRIETLKNEIRGQVAPRRELEHGLFQFRTRLEAQKLASELSLHCAEPMPVAIGLSELFINAIEHGCLRIGHDEKGMLIEEGHLDEEIARRLADPRYEHSFASIEFWRKKDEILFVIKDPGDGFDFERFLHSQDVHTKKHGRGILMANNCFAELRYQGKGNEVHALYRTPA